MEPQQKYDFAIIGGGVYGLSIAYHLSKSQKSVALFERYILHYSGLRSAIAMAAHMDHRELPEVCTSINSIEI